MCVYLCIFCLIQKCKQGVETRFLHIYIPWCLKRHILLWWEGFQVCVYSCMRVWVCVSFKWHYGCLGFIHYLWICGVIYSLYPQFVCNVKRDANKVFSLNALSDDDDDNSDVSVCAWPQVCLFFVSFEVFFLSFCLESLASVCFDFSGSCSVLFVFQLMSFLGFSD